MSNGVVEQVKDRIDLVELVGEKLTLKRSGATSFKACCPFHNEKSASFYVYSDSRRYVCFSCGEKGDCFDWLEKTQGLDFVQALKVLAPRVGVEVPEYTKDNDSPEISQERQALEVQHQRYVDALFATSGKSCLKYLVGRGLTQETIDYFGLGYAPARSEEKPFAGRMMVPLYDELNRLVGLAGRALNDTKPKYINSAQSELFDKGSLLYNLNNAKRHIRVKGEVLIFEGYTDVHLATQHGYGHVVATMGTAITEKQAAKLVGLKARIILCLDGDSAGQMASKQGVKKLREAGNIIPSLYVAVMPQGKDPGDLLSTRPEAFDTLVKKAVPVVEYLIAQWTQNMEEDAWAGRKSFVVTQIAPLIRDLPDPIERDHYITVLAKAISISPDAVREAVFGRKSFNQSKVKDREPVTFTEMPPEVTRRAVSRERLLLGLVCLDPTKARSAGHMLHQDMFADIINAAKMDHIKDTLRYHSDIKTTDQLLDSIPNLEWQEELKDAVDELAQFPNMGSEKTWYAEVESLCNLLWGEHYLRMKQVALLSLPEAIAADDKEAIVALLEQIQHYAKQGEPKESPYFRDSRHVPQKTF
jgi:DNA primase